MLNVVAAYAENTTVGIEIFDTVGKLMTAKVTASQTDAITIDTAALQSGVYIVKVTAGGTTSYSKIVKQ